MLFHGDMPYILFILYTERPFNVVVSMGWMNFPSYDQSSWAHSLEVLKKKKEKKKKKGSNGYSVAE